MSWLPSGRSFCITDQDTFVGKILPKFFREAKFESFGRRLKRWGFRKVYTTGLSQIIFSHDMFHRDRPDLCRIMNGREKAGAGGAPSDAEVAERVAERGMGFGVAAPASGQQQNQPFPPQDQYHSMMFQQSQQFRQQAFQRQLATQQQMSRQMSQQNAMFATMQRQNSNGSLPTSPSLNLNNSGLNLGRNTSLTNLNMNNSSLTTLNMNNSSLNSSLTNLNVNNSSLNSSLHSLQGIPNLARNNASSPEDSSVDSRAVLNEARALMSLPGVPLQDPAAILAAAGNDPGTIREARMQLGRLNDDIANCEEQLAILQQLKDLKERRRLLSGSTSPRGITPSST